MILTMRTDKPEAEVGLYDGSVQMEYKNWHAHRELGKTIHSTIREILDKSGKEWGDITAVIFYEGPGSFTGLRIGASVANALNVLVVNESGDKWIEQGIESLRQNAGGPALPKYGSDPHITSPKK